MFFRLVVFGRYGCNVIRVENFYIVELVLWLEEERKFLKENNRINIRIIDLMVMSFIIFVEIFMFIFIIY